MPHSNDVWTVGDGPDIIAHLEDEIRSNTGMKTIAEFKRQFQEGIQIRQIWNSREGDTGHVFTVTKVQTNGVFGTRSELSRRIWMSFPKSGEIQFTENGWCRLEGDQKIAEYSISGGFGYSGGFEMAQRVNFKCYKCKTYSLTKQGLVRHAGHLYCRPCARSLQEGQQQPRQVKVGRRFQTMLDRLLLEK